MREKAIDKIKSTPEIVDEVCVYGGYLICDLKTGDVYHSYEDGKTCYQKWNDEENKFIPFMWQMGGLKNLNLSIISSGEYN